MKIELFLFTLVLLLSGLMIYIKMRIYQSKIDYENFCQKLIQGSSNRVQSSNQPLQNLPDPIKRYLENALGRHDGPIKHVKLKQVGALRTNPLAKKWLPFSADQLISQSPAVFIWEARVRIAPGVHLRVRDSYAQGIGSGQISLCSAFRVGQEENRPELNSGALYRYLAEAAWHPTVLLPHDGIEWLGIDEHRAVAHLTDSGMSISLEFRVNDHGEITSIFAKERFGLFGNQYERHSWEGRFSDYQEFDGMRIPTRGEVGWHLPEGFWLCWKGEIVTAEFSR